MLLQNYDLSPHDFIILKYINSFESVQKEQIEKHFSGKIDSVSFRLDMLKNSNSGYIVEEFDSYQDDIGFTQHISKNSFHISAIGKKALQDYSFRKKIDKRNMWIRNAWIPIIVSFATTVLTNYILPKLLLLIEWFQNILQKIFSI